MIKLKKVLFTLLFVTGNLTGFSQQNQLAAEDFKMLIGCWEGSLTYLDYSTNKPFSMPADLKVKHMEDPNRFSFANIYPKEPHANSVDTLSISADAKYINNETVKSVLRSADGVIEIITEQSGEDGNDNKKATFRFTYVIGREKYTRKKEVQFVGWPGWMLRHEYIYKRKACE